MLDLVASGLVAGLSRLSHDTVLRTGTVAGLATGRLLRSKHRRICGNLARAGTAFPERIGRRAWRRGGANLFEILWLVSRGPDDPQVRLRVEGSEVLAAAVAEGRGVLLVSAHLGNWEFVPLAAARSGTAVAVVARPLGVRRLEHKWLAFRARCGVRTLLRGEAGSGMAAARWLRRGGILGCMMDRTAQSRRILVPFLGEAMHMPLGPAELAARGGAAIVLGTAQRAHSGETEVRFRRVPSALGLTASAIAHRIAAALEEAIRERPDDWLWIYRRQAYLDPTLMENAG